ALYDPLGHKTSETLRAGTANAATSSWTYGEARPGYSNVGLLTTMSDASGTHQFNYGIAGLLLDEVRIIDGTSYEFKFAYDAGNRLQGISFPDGDALGKNPSTGAGTPLGYDGAGRPYSLPGIVNSATYDAAGRCLVQQNANGSVETRTYSAA